MASCVRSLRRGCSRYVFQQCATPILMVGGACFVTPCCGSFPQVSPSATEFSNWQIFSYFNGESDNSRRPLWYSPGQSPEPMQIAAAAILPASESLAGALNCLVATFPISVLCGLLFFMNYRGLTGELAYVLSARFGLWGWLLLAALAACALGVHRQTGYASRAARAFRDSLSSRAPGDHKPG